MLDIIPSSSGKRTAVTHTKRLHQEQSYDILIESLKTEVLTTVAPLQFSGCLHPILLPPPSTPFVMIADRIQALENVTFVGKDHSQATMRK